MPTTLLDVQEVARRLNLSRTTVRRLAAKGEIPGLRIGGSWRFEELALEAWLWSLRTTPRAQDSTVTVTIEGTR